MVQVLKSTKYFELFGGLNPGTVRVSTENSKDEVIWADAPFIAPQLPFLGSTLGGVTAALVVGLWSIPLFGIRKPSLIHF